MSKPEAPSTLTAETPTPDRARAAYEAWKEIERDRLIDAGFGAAPVAALRIAFLAGFHARDPEVAALVELAAIERRVLDAAHALARLPNDCKARIYEDAKRSLLTRVAALSTHEAKGAAP